MTKKIVFAIVAGSLLANGTLAQKKHPTHSARQAPKKEVLTQYGIASFYANKFNGRRTANGDIFNQKKLTAASNTLALNTWVKVTNLRNKKTVIVQITDRMHRRNKRLIDLSMSAARYLGYTGRGLTRVRVEVLGRHRPSEAEAGASASHN